MTGRLRAELARLATTPTLLVALDFDGVLAPLVDDPSSSRPLPASAEAVRALAGLPGTTVVMLSGRGRDDLVAVSGFDAPVRLVGSHGSEFDPDLAASLGRGEFLTPAQRDRRAALITELRSLVDDVAGARLETKPAGAAVHVRGVDPAAGTALLDRVRAGAATRDGIDATEGKDVVDLAVLQTTKGSAVDALRAHLRPDAVLFAGDDVTDESVFIRLSGPDVGIKVGDGDTAAAHRVGSPEAMAEILTELARARNRGGLRVEVSAPGGPAVATAGRVHAVEIDAAELSTPEQLFDAIAEALDFPDYFGRNWDALEECLSDFLVLGSGGLGSEFGGRAGIDADAVRLTFTRAGGLLRGPDLLSRLAGVLDHVSGTNGHRTAAGLTVVFGVADERERAAVESALAAG